MKTHFFKQLAIVLILVTVLSACEKEKVCGVKHPLKDLPWLKELKKELKAYSSRFDIYQCTYGNGQEGFINDFIYVAIFYNCEGEVLCAGGDANGKSCSELIIDSKKRIWPKYTY